MLPKHSVEIRKKGESEWRKFSFQTRDKCDRFSIRAHRKGYIVRRTTLSQKDLPPVLQHLLDA